MEKTIIGDMELVEYKGVYSLVAVREYQGNHYQQWCRIELGKDKKLSEKSQPMKVTLGTAEQAIINLKAIMDKIDVPF